MSISTIGDKIVETLSSRSNDVTLENKTIHTPPQGLPSYIQSCGVCRFLQDRTALKHFLEGAGRKSVISPFLSQKNDRKALLCSV